MSEPTRPPRPREHWIDRSFTYGTAALFAALTVWRVAQGQWDLVIGDGTLAFLYALQFVTRRMWIRNGNRAGRWEAVDSAREAEARGLDLSQWIVSEYERGLGLHVGPGARVRRLGDEGFDNETT